MTPARPLRIAIVAGEESGDLLGADLVRALAARSGRPVELVGVGGAHLAALGLKSLFDPGDIALMGISAVVARLPGLIRRIGLTARSVVAAGPDVLVTVDSPDFTLRVARRVRAADPSIAIVHYVCPSVWAWRPGRARTMAAFVDHVLCLLPFEPAELARLGGPPGTFVGHRLAHDPALAAAAQRQRLRPPGTPPTLLLLPGSRRGEVSRLLEPFGQTVAILRDRGHEPRLVLPTVPHVRALVERGVASWPRRPEIVAGADGKYRAFGEADAALAASGTVSLELALARVPAVVCYRTDLLFRLVMLPMVRAWTSVLPNLVADRPVMPEYHDHFVRPQMLARQLELLFADTPARAAQLDGFDRVARAMATERPAGDIAAEVVMQSAAAGSRKSAVGNGRQ